MAPNTETTDIAARQVSITRTINAPRELVFEAWTKPEHLINWFGPEGFTNTFIETDIRVGGSWRFIMHGPDGTDYPNLVRFTEITPPERLVYLHGTGEADPDPNAFEGSVTLEDLGGGKTRITLTNTFPTVEARDYVVEHFHAVEGGNQTLSKLAAYVEGLS
jgi:uncharacterized protein YndB with AHSA1/START domain